MSLTPKVTRVIGGVAVTSWTEIAPGCEDQFAPPAPGWEFPPSEAMREAMDRLPPDPRGLTPGEAYALDERKQVQAALERCVPPAGAYEIGIKQAIAAETYRILSRANRAKYVTPPGEARRQIQRLSVALDECQAAILDVSPDALRLVGEADKRRLRIAHAAITVALTTMERPHWKGPPVRPGKVRAAFVADSVLAAFERLTGDAATITRPPDGGSGSGPALLLMREVFEALSVRASAEAQLRQAIDRRRPKRETRLQKQA